MWKERMRQNPSRAEVDILLGLEERGLTVGMFRDEAIILETTTPDYYWPHKGLCVYLDGPPHESEHQRLKDELIDQKLRRMGLRVLRIPYTVPLTKEQREKILDQIEEELIGK
jgi:very-short-patch-repair endonuclease